MAERQPGSRSSDLSTSTLGDFGIFFDGPILRRGDFVRELVRDFDADENKLQMYGPHDHRRIHYENVQRAKRRRKDRELEAQACEAREQERTIQAYEENQRNLEHQAEMHRARRYAADERTLWEGRQRNLARQQQDEQALRARQQPRPGQSHQIAQAVRGQQQR
ncbi:MAG: hypothetical protein Q9187_003319 [Circinaria calcarea]